MSKDTTETNELNSNFNQLVLVPNRIIRDQEHNFSTDFANSHYRYISASMNLLTASRKNLFVEPVLFEQGHNNYQLQKNIVVDAFSFDITDNTNKERGIDTDYTSSSSSSESDEDSRSSEVNNNSAINSSISTYNDRQLLSSGLPSHNGRVKLTQPRRTDDRIREAAILLKLPATTNRVHTSKAGDYLMTDSLTERGPILLDILNGRNELVMAAYSTQSIPKLYPVVDLCKELPGIALPPPIPLDLPKLSQSKKVASITSHLQVVREQPPVKICSGSVIISGGVPYCNITKQQSVANHHRHQAPLSQSVNIINRAALFPAVGNYGVTIKDLDFLFLDEHLILPEKSISYHSLGNQALASMYLGEIEMSWVKYKDAEKYFTRGSKLKTAKEDEISAVCALGNILQSIGDYDQLFEYHEKSLKLAGELGAHGSLAMLGLGQKDKALDHLITAFRMSASARYEGNPLAVGRAVSNLGNAYQAIGKEHYEITLGHAIYSNDLQGQGHACGNIAIIYLLQAAHYYTKEISSRMTINEKTSLRQSVQNVRGSNEALRLSLSLFESNSQPLYEVQETHVELEKLSHQLSKFGVMDMNAAGSQEFTLMYREENHVKVELVLQKKIMHSCFITVPLKILFSYCISKLLIWILLPSKDKAVIKCRSIDIIKENSSIKLNITNTDNKILTLFHVINCNKYHLHLFEYNNVELSLDIINSNHVSKLYKYASACRFISGNTSPNTIFNSISNDNIINTQDSFLVQLSESLSEKVLGYKIYLPSDTVSTISCMKFYDTILQENVLSKRKENITRGFGDGSDSSSSDEDNNGEDKRGIHTSLVSHYHSPNPQQYSLPNSSRYKSLSAAVNTSITPQTSASTGSKHAEGKIQEEAANIYVGIDIVLPKPPHMHTSKGDYLINDRLTERGPILLNVPNDRNELVMAAYSTQNPPNYYPIVGLQKELPGIAFPPPIPLDLPKLNLSSKVKSAASHQQLRKNSSLGTISAAVASPYVQEPQCMACSQQQAPLSQNVDFSDPDSIISRAAVFLTAGDYGATIKLLEVLDIHLVLPQDIEMAGMYGEGLANYKNLHYRAAKPYFNALFEKSINCRSPGNQAVASIYLGEIEMSWENYKDAVKHFTLAVTNYSPDNVAEKFQQMILTKSTVLVKKGQCHRSLSQIKEAINAFKMAKEVAETEQEKEDELSAVSALGDIFQLIGDYEQSFEYYEKSLKLAGELEDQVSIGRAYGNLGNAMLGLDQKDKALDHLITAFHMSTRYEGNPLAIGKAMFNLGNAYQAIGNLKKAKEHYEDALAHAIYGNDLQGQGCACDNIGNIYMLLKEPVKAVHYYTEALHLSTDRSTKITRHHNRGCARFDVAECIIQGKKPKELVPATTQNSEYGRLSIKLTDEVITTDPVQETKPNREPSAQSVSEQKESSMSVEMLPVTIKGKVYEGVASVETVRMAEALTFLETAQRDFLEAIESHEQGVQNVKGSHEALSLSLSLFESNSRSFYKMQETLIELGKLCQRLSKLGLIDMTATESQEFKDALVYGEQARARTLGELILQKKKTMYSDLFSISTPLTIQDIYKTVKLQKFPVVFLSYCVSKLLMWILIPVNDEVIMRCQSVELKEENLENSSFELYIRYNLLQFLSKDEIYIFRRCAYEQESPFTVLHDVIAIKIIEGLKSVGYSEVTEFIVIPDSVTHLLPFSPLMNKHNWQFFGDKFRIRIVPSFLSLLVMSMTSNPVVEIPGDKSDFLIVGNPTIPPFMYDSTQWNLGRLPYAEKEAISVASIIGTIPVLREQATKQSVLYRLRSAKVIHLATHGSAFAGFLAFTSSFPVSKSGLAEKEHILIFPKEIETLNISPALVVLSSCDSARGLVKAEEVIGMARAFLSAGAHSVLVSLWRVPDESAHVFMNFFYQFLVNGLPSLQALQRSMQCLRCFLKYSHYVHWSGFQIIGKEVTFHKDSNAQFPIQKLLGEASIFPRQHVKNMEENLLGAKNNNFTDVQVRMYTFKS